MYRCPNRISRYQVTSEKRKSPTKTAGPWFTDMALVPSTVLGHSRCMINMYQILKITEWVSEVRIAVVEKRQAEVFVLGAGGNREPLNVLEETTDLVREIFFRRRS